MSKSHKVQQPFQSEKSEERAENLSPYGNIFYRWKYHSNKHGKTYFATALDKRARDEFIGQINKFTPHIKPSAIVRMALYIIMAIGIDTLVKFGVFSYKSEEAIVNIAKKVRSV